MAMLQMKIKNHKIEVDQDGVKVVVSGDGKLKGLEIDGKKMDTVVKAINEAISKAQGYAAEEMKGVMGDLQKILGSMGK
jgi:DNA-binding protein YbaB